VLHRLDVARVSQDYYVAKSEFVYDNVARVSIIL
jgi:hypothetical protein